LYCTTEEDTVHPQRLFDRHGHGYDRMSHRLVGRLHRRVVADAVAAVPPDGIVLDAGCGPGRLAVALATARPDLTVYGIDISPDMVQVARQHMDEAGVAGRTRIDEADIADLPLGDRSVDLVVSTISFHHWQDVPGAARELTRIIRPDGRIWIYDFRFAPWRRLATALGAPVPRTPISLLMTRAELTGPR
jgi:ubiquinone/menaquinone biosynthesis C-methylase UbiE